MTAHGAFAPLGHAVQGSEALNTDKILATLRFVATAVCIASTPLTVAATLDIQGHRGARGLAPENTLAAFRRAIEIGVTTLETDVVITRDGVPVISHNPELDPDLVRDAHGNWLAQPGPPIHSLLRSQLEQYDIGRLNPQRPYARDFPEQKAADGERFTTLGEVVQLVRLAGKRVRLNVETKLTPDSSDSPDPEAFVRAILDALKDGDMTDRATIQSFDWRTLIEAKRIAPRIETSCLTIESRNMNTMTPAVEGRSRCRRDL